MEALESPVKARPIIKALGVFRVATAVAAALEVFKGAAMGMAAGGAIATGKAATSRFRNSKKN